MILSGGMHTNQPFIVDILRQVHIFLRVCRFIFNCWFNFLRFYSLVHSIFLVVMRSKRIRLVLGLVWWSSERRFQLINSSLLLRLKVIISITLEERLPNLLLWDDLEVFEIRSLVLRNILNNVVAHYTK